MRRKQEEYWRRDFHLPTRVRRDATEEAGASDDRCCRIGGVLVALLLGVLGLAFEEEVGAFFLARDIRGGARRAHEAVRAKRVDERPFDDAPPSPNPARLGTRVDLPASLEDGDGSVGHKHAWGEGDEYGEELRAIKKEMGGKNVMAAHVPSLTPILKSALDAAEAKGATAFFAWKRVKPDCVVTEAAAMHSARQIRGAKLVMSPYPHVQVFNIFPDALYACIVQKLPPGDDAYLRLKEGVDRFMVNLYDRKTAGTKADDKTWAERKGKGGFDSKFWRQLGKVYASSPSIRDAWIDKFAPTLAIRHPNVDARVKNSIHTKMELNRDRAGYEIGPHTDSQGKWVTTLYYLAKDLEHENTGTCVVRSKSGREQKGASDWEDWRDPDFEVAEQARYVPNSVFAFAPCYSSWHAVRMASLTHLYLVFHSFPWFLLATSTAPSFYSSRVESRDGRTSVSLPFGAEDDGRGGICPRHDSNLPHGGDEIGAEKEVSEATRPGRFVDRRGDKKGKERVGLGPNAHPRPKDPGSRKLMRRSKARGCLNI